MSAKNTDRQGRLRSKTIAFRMSPEKAELLQRMADASGMTKQDYLIERALYREVTVIPNKRMQRYMEEGCCSSTKSSEGLKAAGHPRGACRPCLHARGRLRRTRSRDR